FEDFQQRVGVGLAGGAVCAGNTGGFGRHVAHGSPPRWKTAELRREFRAIAPSRPKYRTRLEAHIHSTHEDYLAPNSAAAGPAGRSRAARSRQTRVRTARRAGGRALQKGLIGLEAQEVPADGLEVGLAALELLGHGVDVAKAPLEGAAGEDGARPGRVMDRIHHLLGLVDAVGGGEANLHPLLHAERAPGAAHVGPDAP